MTTTLPSSNSSETLRNQLKANYVTLPKILDNKPFRDYIQYAIRRYNDGDSFYHKDDIMNAYIKIGYQCFFTFVFQKLRYHSSYSDKTYANDIKDIKKKMEIAIQRLEVIVKRLDDYEDQKLLDSLDDDDNDENNYIFVNDDSANTITQNVDGRGSRILCYSYNRNNHDTNNNNEGVSSSSSSSTSCDKAIIAADHTVDSLTKAFELLKPEIGITPSNNNNNNKIVVASAPELAYSDDYSSYDHSSNVMINDAINTNNSNNYNSSIEVTAKEQDRFLGVTVMDVEIVRYLSHAGSIYTTFPIPPPLLKSLVLHLPSSPTNNANIDKINKYKQTPQVIISSKPVSFHRDDFSVTFLPFFNDPSPSQSQAHLQLQQNQQLQSQSQTNYVPLLPVELQSTKSAVESNRCFFLHLGIAMNIHPFALQIVFRHLAGVKKYQIQNKKNKNSSNNNANSTINRINNITTNNNSTNTNKINNFSRNYNNSTTSSTTANNNNNSDDGDYVILDILSSLELYAGFVDANCLLFLWPVEFNDSRICIVSGTDTAPMFSCYYAKGADTSKLRDVIIHCDGSHFTLLRPVSSNHHQQQPVSFQILSELLRNAKEAGLTVINNEVDCQQQQPSIVGIINSLINHSN